MGYDTQFKGKFVIDGQLTSKQEKALRSLSKVRHEDPPMPSIYCQWILIQDENDVYSIQWDGNEKFYEYTKWLEYIVDQLSDWNLKINGKVLYRGESIDDIGYLIVKDNVVTVDKIKIE